MTGRPEHPRLGEGDFWALQAAGDWSVPFELIEGEPVALSPLDVTGVAVCDAVRSQLRRWQERVGDDGLVVAETPVALTDQTWLRPDIAYWSWDRLPQRLGVAGQPMPDLVVCVERSGSPELSKLRREHAGRAGVGEVWTVMPETQRVATLRGAVLEGEDVLLSPRLGGFSVSASELFEVRPDGRTGPPATHTRGEDS